MIIPEPQVNESQASGPYQSSSNLQRYINEVGQYELLSNDESIHLARRFVESKDRDAAQKLILANLRLVVKIAHNYQSRWKSNLMDLIQEGNAGLVRAIQKYDPERQVTFGTYAAFWIRSYILNFLMDNTRLIKINTTQTMRRMYYNYSKTKQQLELQTGRADDDSLAEALQISTEELAKVDERINGSEISLATPMSDDSKLHLQDIIKHPGLSVFEEVEAKELQDKVRLVLENEKPRLTFRENLILYERLMSDSPATLATIGNRLDISRERARQLEVKLKKKLKRIFMKAFMDEERMLATG